MRVGIDVTSLIENKTVRKGMFLYVAFRVITELFVSLLIILIVMAFVFNNGPSIQLLGGLERAIVYPGQAFVRGGFNFFTSFFLSLWNVLANTANSAKHTIQNGWNGFSNWVQNPSLIIRRL